MKGAAGLVTALALAGCDQAPSAPATVEEPFTWRAAAGGGQVARTELTIAGGSYRSETATRCWPAAGGYDCLSVSSTSTSGHSGRRFHATTLPGNVDALARLTGTAGYSCGFVPEQRLSIETISGPHGPLVEHSWLPIAPKRPWSSSYVRGFLRDNAVGGSPWFRCVELMHLLDHGSIDTLATTAVSRRLLV